ARLDATRRLDVRRREHAAILARLEEAERDEPEQLAARVPARAVVAHRQQWTRDRLSADLRARDVDVLLACDNGADVLGTCVAEQPALLLVDELLAMRSGAEVVQEVRQFCPYTVVVGHVTDERGIGRLLDAGATAVFTARARPDRIVEEVVGLL
ncbi:MAG: hypothetical protein M3P93_12100, partial [Actinomycetota bacterium]|nr:hypothetical protein [Actinomycetota bacterium]